MLSIPEVERILEHVTPELRDIVLELRNIVADLDPDATEEYRNKGFIIYDARRGGPVSARKPRRGPDHQIDHSDRLPGWRSTKRGPGNRLGSGVHPH